MKEYIKTVNKLNYYLYLPEAYEAKTSWPLILFLHGSGERGNNLELVKINGIPKYIAAHPDFPFIAIVPQCPLKSDWVKKSGSLLAILDETSREYKVDQDRVHITGLSMGGFGTWHLAAQEPNRFASAVPICGGGDPALAKNFVHLPIWAFHGKLDTVVPCEGSIEMVNAINAAGGNAKLTLYEDLNHDSWSVTYDNPELYEWLLSHKR